jgi:putative Holliday junction resolvase
VTGTWVGVDVGTVRVGVAISDPAGILATPVATLARDPRHDTDIAQLVQLVHEREAVGVVVGLPVTLRGREGPSAAMARDYAARLAAAIAPVRVEHVDERLTTVSAQRKLAGGTVRGAKAAPRAAFRGARAQRAVIDQVAAVELLQHWLDTRRGTAL